MGLILNRLGEDAIDEKIYLNQKQANLPIEKLKEELKKELSEFTWEQIRCGVQIQFLKEQIEHIDKRIKQIANVPNPYMFDNYKEKLAEVI